MTTLTGCVDDMGNHGKGLKDLESIGDLEELRGEYKWKFTPW